MQFAASWCAPTGARNKLLIAPFGASFNSGKLHCVLLVNVPQPFAREHLLLRSQAACVFSYSDATPERH